MVSLPPPTEAGGSPSGIASQLPRVTGAVVFLLLFWAPMSNTAQQWWTNPDAGHGLLLAPLALFLAWRGGVAEGARGQQVLGLVLLTAAVLLRYASGLATELFTMRLSVLGAVAALIVFAWGTRQLMRWWLPGALLLLTLPLPEIVLTTLALPLQFKASQMGAALMEWRHVPVMLEGNVIYLPGGYRLFVTEACSGLRSLSALLSLGVLVGGLWLRGPWARVLLVITAIPVAIVLNGVRVFLTGFLMYYVDPRLGEGLMHYTEGWVMFVVALALLGGFAAVLTRIESVRASTQLAATA